MRRTSEQTISAHTHAAPATVFDTLRNASEFASWLPHSLVYRGTIPTRHRRPLAVGDTYRDRTALGTLHGHVLAAVPSRRIEFDQATASHGLRIRIVYALTPAPDGGTRIDRTGTITTAGLLRAIHAPVVGFTRRENRRTLDRLTAALDRKAVEPAA
ncbi:SRPBCC family protein [Microbacterium sp. 22303]|uniref:SRPBCC family protein n=1 Tax=Microbacterium sp. 22303 TaxID=3453905 RepID=UPI003F82F463